MCADRADLGRLPANHDMSAVGALPYTVAVAGKDQLILDIPEQPAVAFLVLLFDRADHLKQIRDMVEALLTRLLGEGGVHVGPLVVFALCGSLEVGCGIINAAVEQFEPDFRVLLLVCGGFLEDFRNLHIAVLFRLGGKERVLVACHGFACKCGLQVCFGAGALEFCHNSYPFSAILPVDSQTVLTALLVFLASAANTLKQNFISM